METSAPPQHHRSNAPSSPWQQRTRASITPPPSPSSLAQNATVPPPSSTIATPFSSPPRSFSTTRQPWQPPRANQNTAISIFSAFLTTARRHSQPLQRTSAHGHHEQQRLFTTCSAAPSSREPVPPLHLQPSRPPEKPPRRRSSFHTNLALLCSQKSVRVKP
ncbi:pectinesterase inhibitor 10-like [Vigna unguiculata]|uniref:pectinesterase inhibitor 10-like n=1 Tax=Vigna unguiculata TaxID=3917 RepID=UPI001016EF97|nr:pectinesterase inhibitor 10-like [Vigna unguiculata]XP_027912637.1 pectinesterase inhibitor 10-like [Vigna unguiculata]